MTCDNWGNHQISFFNLYRTPAAIARILTPKRQTHEFNEPNIEEAYTRIAHAASERCASLCCISSNT